MYIFDLTALIKQSMLYNSSLQILMNKCSYIYFLSVCYKVPTYNAAHVTLCSVVHVGNA